MPAASRSNPLIETWRGLSPEQRVAGVGAILLIVSTFGPFSFVEAAIVLVGLAVLVLLRKRAEGGAFHLPFGDGTVIALAGLWCGFLILIRLFDRPLGQNLLALACAAILLAAGVRERAKRPADDTLDERARQAGGHEPAYRPAEPRDDPGTAATEDLEGSEDAATARLDDLTTRPLPRSRGSARSDEASTRPLPEEPPKRRRS